MSNCNISYKDLEASDIDKIVPSDAFTGITKDLFMSSFSSRRFVGYTVLFGEEVLAVLVMSFMWRGVADVVTLISDSAKDHPITFHKTVLRLLNKTIDQFEINRVQAIVKSDFYKGKKWLASLGFAHEGLMRKFGPNGEDYIFMARIKD